MPSNIPWEHLDDGEWWAPFVNGFGPWPSSVHRSVSCLNCGYHIEVTDESGTGVGIFCLSQRFASHACTG